MLAWLVRSALQQRVLVLALAVVLILLGLRAARDVPMDVFPEFAPPMVEVQTEGPGLSTEEVETLITIPLEVGVNGTPGLKTLRSKSVLGLSSVVMIFAEGTDVVRARQLVQERVSLVAARMPAGVRPPTMLPPLSATSRALKIGVSSKTRTPWPCPRSCAGRSGRSSWPCPAWRTSLSGGNRIRSSRSSWIRTGWPSPASPWPRSSAQRATPR